MKNITDTYCFENGVKKRINGNVKIHSDNEVIKLVLGKISEKEVENEISDIFFKEIDNEIISEVKTQFKDADLSVAEAYVIKIGRNSIVIYGNSTRAYLYGTGALYRRYEGGVEEGLICNIPICRVRAIKLYVPSRDNIDFFKNFADMCMHYGYNTFYLEIGGAMEYKKHPEINEGWVEYCKIFEEYSGKTKDVQNCMVYNKNSIHCENGGGSYLTQEEIKDIIDYCGERGIDVIPEVPSLSHSDYLLTRHPELAENKDDPLPDVYCPSNPQTYELLFDVLDEVIDVFKPRMVHIAHDEWYALPLCEECGKQKPGDIFAQDVNKIYNYLKEKGIETMIWGDRLLNASYNGEPWIGGGVRVRKVKSDRRVDINGNIYPVYEEYWGSEVDESEGGEICYYPPTYDCIDKISSDVRIMNWSYSFKCGDEFTDYILQKHNFKSIYGNFNFGMMDFENWFDRITDCTEGVVMSNWSVADEQHMQRNAIFLSVVYGASMIWNRDYDHKKVSENILKAAHELFEFHYKEIKKGSYIEIIHTTDEVIEHPVFVDGNFIDDEKFKMGSYDIVCSDGTIQPYDIYWGRNIGPDTELSNQPESMTDGMTALSTYTREATYTCDYVMDNGHLLYKLIIPTSGNVERVVQNFGEKYKDSITVKSIRIINN